MKLLKGLYGLCGIALVLGVIVTSTNGLSKVNREVYDKALSIQEEMYDIGFKDFLLSDYKVRFYDGDNDYVVKDNEVKKEKPAIPIFVGTAYEVDNEYQVILPTLENFEKMFSLMNTAGKVANISSSSEEDKSKMSGESSVFDVSSYGKEEHVSTLYHEGFHAYQFTKYKDNIMNIIRHNSILKELEMQEAVVKYADSNVDAVKLFEDEMNVLNKAYFEENEENKKEYIKEYLNISEKRNEILSKDILDVERYYDNIEGTACYIESNAFMIQKGEESFKENYFKDFTYTKGSSKYYNRGMIKCWILSQMNSEWNKDYDFEKPLDELLKSEIE